jgi:hypothetical protein
MKKEILITLCTLLVAASMMAFAQSHKWVTDNQVAAGEWKIELQTPPCDHKNLQVIWPKESGAPMTVECDLMPVGER